MEDRKRKAIPEFTSEDEERAFWAAADSTEYIDWIAGERVQLPADAADDFAAASAGDDSAAEDS